MQVWQGFYGILQIQVHDHANQHFHQGHQRLGIPDNEEDQADTQQYHAVKCDLRLLKKVQKEPEGMNLVKRLGNEAAGFTVNRDAQGRIMDPKAEALVETLRQVLNMDTARARPKAVVFSEYIDTVLYLRQVLEERFNGRVLVVPGDREGNKDEVVNLEFDASVLAKDQTNDYDILLTTDKMSEGVNLNRAVAVTNYDIPWNPVRVIQRIGRINRIGHKVFDELYIYNFFPTEQGADELRSREIAANKLFMIHKALGEDSKVFDPGEEPSPARLYQKLQRNPEEGEEEGLLTRLRQEYARIQQKHPDVVQQAKSLFPRVKTSDQGKMPELYVFRRKGLGMFVLQVPDTVADRPKPAEITFEQGLDAIRTTPDRPDLGRGPDFERAYKAVLKHGQNRQGRPQYPANSIEAKALNNLMTAKRHYLDMFSMEDRGFIDDLIEDMENYFTLPKYTLRRLQEYDLNPDAETPEQRLQGFQKALALVKGMLGADYLDSVKHRAQHLSDEVIISVEHLVKD